jgi:arylformamidase
MPVYRDYDQAALDAQYNPRAATPSFVHHLRRWGDSSEAARAGAPAKRLDLAYGPGPAERLDFFPAQGHAAPLLAFIHGGEWQSLDKADFAFLAPAFAAHGISVALIGHGQAPDIKLAAMVEQCRAAIAWLYRNAAELEIDATRMHLAGHGTGGHLAMMAVAKPWRSFELLGNPVQSALALGGIYDLAPVRLSYLNGALQLDAESCETLSPIHRPAPLACRVLVASGGRESLEYRRQAHAFAAAWRGQGCAIDLLELPGEDHFSLLDRLPEFDGALGSKALMAVLDG